MQQKFKTKLILLTTAMLLASCAAITPERIIETKVIDTSCSWAKVITISLNDQISDATARQILAHNRQVTKNCP
jgi:uncharacterized lipoprotein YajG